MHIHTRRRRVGVGVAPALAGVSALILVPASALLLVYSAIIPVYKLVIAMSLLVMAGCIYLVVKSRGNPRNFLLIQCAYYAAFLLPIMAVSYLQ